VKGSWRGHGFLSSGLKYQGELSALYSSGDEWIYPLVKEAYLEKGFSSGGLKLGVVNHQWSAFEEEWRLGLYRPRFMYNKLSGGQGGLFGAHFSSEGFSVGVLPVFIPEFGPHFNNSNGQIRSGNPWFGQLPKTLSYGGSDAPLKYDVVVPPLEKIVFKPGLVSSYENRLNKNIYSRWSAAYKPIPQLLLNFPSDRRFILGSEEQYFSVEVQPWVAYHGVVSMDQWIVTDDKSSSFRFSLAHEQPDVPSRPRTWVTQEIGPATFLSSRLETTLSSFWNSKVYLSQFKVWGGDRSDEGRYATDETFFETRQFYREAYGVGAETLWPGRWNFSSSVSFVFDLLQEGGVFSTKHSFSFRRDLSFFARADFLGLFTDSNPVPTGFLSRYRANDRAEVGVNYVF